MTRSHFELIARTLKEARTNTGMGALPYAHLVDTFAAALADTNPRFNREAFVAACGIVRASEW